MANKKQKDLMGGTITEIGSSIKNETGGWRIFRPVWNKKKCTQCMACWMYCPDCAITQKNGKRIETDFKFCKGCGICKTECIFGAIYMEKEKK